MSAAPAQSIEAARRNFEAGRYEATESGCREILQSEPGNAEAWNLLGIAACRQNRHKAGVSALQRALFLEGGRADIHMNLGIALRESGDAERAQRSFQGAIALEPSYALAHYNMGLALEDRGRREEALASYRHALRLAPDLALAHLNAGGILEFLGRPREAMQAYREAIRCDPQLVPAYRNVAALLEEEGKLNEAIAWCQQALKLDTEDADTLYTLGLLLEQHGATDYAAQAVKRAIERAAPARQAEMHLTLALMLPPITQSREHIAGLRARLERGLDALAAARPRFGSGIGTLSPPFYLAYHGECNRDLHRKLASLLVQASPDLAWTAPHCLRWNGPRGRIKLGFLSRFLRNHSIGKTTRGLIAELDRSRFEVTALFLPPAAADSTASFIRERADRSVTLPAALPAAREAIAELELDVLFYQDIGMEATSYLLAFARLAPVQCVSFGHPDTTGVPAMDWFVSSQLFEPEGAEAHYSERLFLLRDAGTLAYYYRPRPRGAVRGRAAFRLPAGGPLYLCPQTLFKLHPDVDALFAGILRADPAGNVVLLAGKHPQWVELLRARFERTMPDVAGRVLILPELPAEDFLELLALADVVLDTPHFNGMNTSLEAFAMGTPIVTLPGAYQRGRHTLGMYRRMEIEEGVATDAEDYVRIAVRLGTDRTARAALSRRLLERCPRLFEDANVVREFERFFAFAVDDARARPPLAPPPALPGEAQARAEVERGNALGEEGDFEAAEACFRRALQWLPDAPAILANLGSALQFLGRSEEAVALCERALAIDPGFARAHCNLAAAQRNLGRHEAAIASARRAAALSPGLAYGHNDLAATLIQLRRLGEAEASIEEALRREPDNVDAHWNRAFLLLLQGRYEEGWREYEWRWVQDRDMRRQAGRFLQPRWRGEAAAGKTVLLHTEQGLGDGIQFIRYAPLVAARGLRVLCHCAPALEKLLALADGVERVVRPDAPERIDYHCPLMSLPLVFGTTLDTIPAQAPYLRLPPALLERWAARLGPREGPRVGLAWSSNPHRENRKVGTARSKLHRACPASLLAPLARVAGVQFVSLQKDPPPGEVPHLPLLDLMGEVDDLVDTAAIVSQLDLVISIDTCVAHLAGALGKPLWVMLPFDNEWRWLLDRADSPWYPTARLYRQRRAGDWEQVVAEVAMDLSSYRP